MRNRNIWLICQMKYYLPSKVNSTRHHLFTFSWLIGSTSSGSDVLVYQVISDGGVNYQKKSNVFFLHNAEFLYLDFLSKDCVSSSNHEAHYGRMWKQKESKWDICISGHLTPQPSHHGGQILLFIFSTPPKSDRQVNSV